MKAPAVMLITAFATAEVSGLTHMRSLNGIDARVKRSGMRLVTTLELHTTEATTKVLPKPAHIPTATAK